MDSSPLKGSPSDRVGFKCMHYLSWDWKQAWETVLTLELGAGWGVTFEDISPPHCSPLTDFVEQDEHVAKGEGLGGVPCRFPMEERGERVEVTHPLPFPACLGLPPTSLQQQQLQAQHLSHATHGPPVQLPPHPSGLQPPGIPPVTGSSSGLLALGALGSQAHLAVKDEKNHHELDHRGVALAGLGWAGLG